MLAVFGPGRVSLDHLLTQSLGVARPQALKARMA
jgi:hypothetical protein